MKLMDRWHALSGRTKLIAEIAMLLIAVSAAGITYMALKNTVSAGNAWQLESSSGSSADSSVISNDETHSNSSSAQQPQPSSEAASKEEPLVSPGAKPNPPSASIPTNPPPATSSAPSSELPPSKPQPPPAPVWGNAPDFTIQSLAGQSFTLSSGYGKPTIINFWGYWCPYCVTELPDFQKLYLMYKDKVNFVMVNCGDDKTQIQSKLNADGYTFPVYLDGNKRVASLAYNVSTFPRTCIIDKDGNLIKTIFGMTDYATLKAVLDTVV